MQTRKANPKTKNINDQANKKNKRGDNFIGFHQVKPGQESPF